MVIMGAFVLSDIHQGLSNVRQLQDSIDMLLHLGPSCKVVLGGDSTNTTTGNSKGNVLKNGRVVMSKYKH